VLEPSATSDVLRCHGATAASGRMPPAERLVATVRSAATESPSAGHCGAADRIGQRHL